MAKEWPREQRLLRDPQGVFGPAGAVDWSVFRINENVGVDRLRCSAAIPEVEELVAIQDVHPGLKLRIPTL